MTVGHVLLGLLSAGERHGYDLKHQYDERFPAARPLAFGQVYTALQGLAKHGWAEPGDRHTAGAAERTVYRMTEAGRGELERWLGEVESPAPHGNSPLQVKVTLALLVAGEDAASDYLHAQRSAHLHRMRHYTRVVSDPDASPAQVLAADYALTHLEADLRWLDNARARVHDLAGELAART